MGFTLDDYGDEFTQVEVFPENYQASIVFQSLLTQWRLGFNGPVGLDYAVVPTVLKLHGIKRKRWEEIFHCLRVMEDEALVTIHNNK